MGARVHKPVLALFSAPDDIGDACSCRHQVCPCCTYVVYMVLQYCYIPSCTYAYDCRCKVTLGEVLGPMNHTMVSLGALMKKFVCFVSLLFAKHISSCCNIVLVLWGLTSFAATSEIVYVLLRCAVLCCVVLCCAVLWELDGVQQTDPIMVRFCAFSSILMLTLIQHQEP